MTDDDFPVTFTEPERRARVDKITAEYYRKGTCKVCGNKVERSRTFRGTDLAALEKLAEEWGNTPLVHKRCETKGTYTCNACPEHDPFKVPADEVGTALMQQHLLAEHGVRTP